MAVDLKGAPNREGFYFGPLKCSKICFSHYCIGMKKYLNQCKAERCPRRLGACQPDVSQAPRRTRLHGRSIRNSILIGQRLQPNVPAQFREWPGGFGLVSSFESWPGEVPSGETIRQVSAQRNGIGDGKLQRLRPRWISC